MQIGLGLSMTRMRRGSTTAPFTPASLFANGEQGLHCDPSDLSMMFQDAAGTIPVTATGQPVGRTLDKSGRGNHVTWQNVTYGTDGTLHWLTFNGSNAFGQTAPIDFSVADEMFVSAGVRKLSDAATAAVVELSNNPNNNAGSFGLFAPPSTSPRYGYASRGTATAVFAQTASEFLSPHSAVLSGLSDISGDMTRLVVNGVTRSNLATDQGAGNYGNYPIYIGARAGTSLYYNGRVHGLIIRGKLPTAAELTQTEAYMAGKTGVTL